MDNIDAYNEWANTYDSALNKTRDMEGRALREVLTSRSFNYVLEIGCGTGKNTEWLIQKAKSVVGADFSEEMMRKARQKVDAPNVDFVRTDIREPWHFQKNYFDLVTFSLVLEHIQNIHYVFEQAAQVLKPDGFLYLGELHPFKQYQGSKARFEREHGVFELECFTHNISAYFEAGKQNGFECVLMKEWFDENKATLQIPRLLTMLFKKIQSD